MLQPCSQALAFILLSMVLICQENSHADGYLLLASARKASALCLVPVQYLNSVS